VQDTARYQNSLKKKKKKERSPSISL